MSLTDYARRYAELEWALVELDGKMPKGYGWQNSSPLDPKSAAEIWASRNGANMGVVLGPSGIIDFELDSGDEELYWSLVSDQEGEWPDTPVYITGSGKPHVFFRDPGGLTRRTRGGLELRAGPHQSVIPPSIHPETRVRYHWVKDPVTTPLADPPQRLLDFFSASNNGPSESHWRQPLSSGRKLGEGEGRHASLISFLGKAVNVFDTVEQVVSAALFYSQETHDPPYPEHVIEDQAVDCWHRYRDAPETPDEAEEYLHVLRGDRVEVRTVDFLWKPYLQKSAFHLLVGRKAAGKGSVLAWIAANMTQGTFNGEATDVLWIATEDSLGIDVLPRFSAQSGDERRIWCADKPVRLPRDLPAIRAFCLKHEIGLVVIDPIAGVIGDVDTNSEGPIIAAIGGLNHLADELNLTVIGVRHTGKNMNEGVLSSVLGSVAWVNTPRAVLGIRQDEHKMIHLDVLSSNRVRSNETAMFRLDEVGVGGRDGAVPMVVPCK